MSLSALFNLFYILLNEMLNCVNDVSFDNLHIIKCNLLAPVREVSVYIIDQSNSITCILFQVENAINLTFF